MGDAQVATKSGERKGSDWHTGTRYFERNVKERSYPPVVDFPIYGLQNFIKRIRDEGYEHEDRELTYFLVDSSWGVKAENVLRPLNRFVSQSLIGRARGSELLLILNGEKNGDLYEDDVNTFRKGAWLFLESGAIQRDFYEQLRKDKDAMKFIFSVLLLKRDEVLMRRNKNENTKEYSEMKNKYKEKSKKFFYKDKKGRERNISNNSPQEILSQVRKISWNIIKKISISSRICLTKKDYLYLLFFSERFSVFHFLNDKLSFCDGQ